MGFCVLDIVVIGELGIYFVALMQVLKTRCPHTKQRFHQQKIVRSTT